MFEPSMFNSSRIVTVDKSHKEPSVRPTIEGLAKAITASTFIIYIIGFASYNSYLSMYGIYEYDAIKSQYLGAGFNYAIFAAGYYFFVIRLFDTFQDRTGAWRQNIRQNVGWRNRYVERLITLLAKLSGFLEGIFWAIFGVLLYVSLFLHLENFVDTKADTYFATLVDLKTGKFIEYLIIVIAMCLGTVFENSKHRITAKTTENKRLSILSKFPVIRRLTFALALTIYNISLFLLIITWIEVSSTEMKQLYLASFVVFYFYAIISTDARVHIHKYFHWGTIAALFITSILLFGEFCYGRIDAFLGGGKPLVVKIMLNSGNAGSHESHEDIPGITGYLYLISENTKEVVIAKEKESKPLFGKSTLTPNVEKSIKISKDRISAIYHFGYKRPET